MKMSDRIRVSGKVVGDSLKAIGREIHFLSEIAARTVDRINMFLTKDDTKVVDVKSTREK